MKVELIPWDPDSADHVERLFDQRVQCGWASNKVRDSWTAWQREGMRSLFWLVMEAEGDPKLDDMVAAHLEKNPKYKTPLQDTCQSIGNVARKPTNASFHPLGHIALDRESAHGKDMGADLEEDGLYWIGPLYVAWELQAVGIGRAAMDATEAMAVRAPLHAKALGLDTLAKKHQEDPAFCAAHYEKTPHTTNQGWYERRGFQVFKTAEDLYEKSPDKNGKKWHMTTVFMKKRLVDDGGQNGFDRV